MGRAGFLVWITALAIGALALTGCAGDGDERTDSDVPVPDPTHVAMEADLPGAERTPRAIGARAKFDPLAMPQEPPQAASPGLTSAPAHESPAQELAEETGAAPLEALIFLEPRVVAQGQTFLVALDTANASAASIALDGHFISLTREGDRFFTILPVPVDQEPGALSMVVAVADQEGRLALREDVSVGVVETEFPVEAVEIDGVIARLLDPEVVAEDYALREAVQRVRSPQRLWANFFTPPTEGVIVSPFGVLRSYNGSAPTDYHTGLDFAGPLGTEVIAPNDAVVAWVGETERRGRGVILDHGGGIFTSYWHLSGADATRGASVARGAVIGRIGTSGLSTGPHLHWELVVHGVPIDPLPWLRELAVPDPTAVFDPVEAVNAGAPLVVGPVGARSAIP